jgi:hypothetical protein
MLQFVRVPKCNLEIDEKTQISNDSHKDIKNKNIMKDFPSI